MNEEWQLCSSGEAVDDKRQWMAQEGEPKTKEDRHCHSCSTQSHCHQQDAGISEGPQASGSKSGEEKVPGASPDYLSFWHLEGNGVSWTIKFWCCYSTHVQTVTMVMIKVPSFPGQVAQIAVFYKLEKWRWGKHLLTTGKMTSLSSRRWQAYTDLGNSGTSRLLSSLLHLCV